MSAVRRATCMGICIGTCTRNSGGLLGRKRPSLAQRSIRQSSSSTSSNGTAKYNLRKLSKEEMTDLESKIFSYNKSPAAAAAAAKSTQQTDQNNSTQSTQPTESKEPYAIKLTDSAIKRLKYLSEKRQKTQYLRLRVDSGGCYGFSYMLDMTEEPEEHDVVLDRKGAKVVIDDCSLPLVQGATIDWQDRLIGQAFLVVANPNSSGGCGCGASFEIKLD
ncbi:[4Fe-4S] proteins maturation [Coemansia asiatica]|uniref:[4Fe-4S] proteins maturation n=1 Tax=Coemansia asiatica TaxID=1052880 RepID=A0A9W8CHK6_9FUNG|nr:[4Fe-4S] proteins maturation [Coemansia asiatica]